MAVNGCLENGVVGTLARDVLQLVGFGGMPQVQKTTLVILVGIIISPGRYFGGKAPSWLSAVNGHIGNTFVNTSLAQNMIRKSGFLHSVRPSLVLHGNAAQMGPGRRKTCEHILGTCPTGPTVKFGKMLVI